MDKSRCMKIFEIYAPELVSKKFKEYLDQKGYFTAPASTKYHGVHDGGLFEHSFAVFEILIDYTQKKMVHWDRMESPFIIGMFHDICKMDRYIKDDDTGEWRYDKENINKRYHTGHAEKSLLMLMGYLKLTEQEIMCIRWHMGAFDTQENWELFGQAIETCPEVLYVHTADMHASRIRGI